MSSPRDTVLAMYDGLARGDLDAAAALLAEDVAWRSSVTMPWGREIEGKGGRAGARRYMEQVGEALDASIEIDEIVEDGGKVVVLGEITGTARATGRPAEVRFAHYFEVRDGVIVTHRGFPDTAAVLQATDAAG